MFTLFTHVLCIYFGYFLGTALKNAVFESQPWQLLRWDDAILGYRTVPMEYEPKSNERLLMSLELDPELVEMKNAE